MGKVFILMGILAFLTPAILAMQDGCRSDADFIHWLMDKSVSIIFLIRASMLGSGLLICAGLLMIWRP